MDLSGGIKNLGASSTEIWRLTRVSERGSESWSGGELKMEEWLVFLGGGCRSGSGRMGEPQDLGVLRFSGRANRQDLFELSRV